MKANVHDLLNNLSPERREEIEHIVAKANQERDEHTRRVCSSFGYKYGGYWAMVWCIVATLFVAIASVMGFALLPSTQEMAFETKIAVMIGIASLPCLVIPVLLFVFLKVRYALRVLAVLIVVTIIGQLLFGMIDPLIHAAVDALLEAQ